MQNKIYILIKLGLLVCAAHSMAFATSIKVLIYTEEWPPLNYMDANDEIRGHATGQVRTLMDAAGISYDIQLVSWNRGYQLSLATPNTLIYTILKTPEREDLFHWYCPIAEPQQISLFRLTSRSEIKVKELQDAKAFILGVNRGDYPSEYLMSKGFTPEKNLIFTSNDDVSLQQLLNGRIDLLVQSKPSLHYRLSKMGIATATVTEVLGSINGIRQKSCLAINKESDPKLIKLLDKTFAHLKTLEN